MVDQLTSTRRAGPFPLKRILVLGDRSEAMQNAAWRAGLLAQEHGAWLRVLQVPGWGAGAEPAQRQLDALAWQLQERLRIAVIAQSVRGGLRRELAAAAADADLIVIAGAPQGGLQGWLAGLRLRRLLRLCGLPVLVVRKPAAVAYGRVVAGVHDAFHAGACVVAASGMAGGPQLELLRETVPGGRLAPGVFGDDGRLASVEARINELAQAAPGSRMREAPSVVRTASAQVLLEWERLLFPDLLVLPAQPPGVLPWLAPWRQVLAGTRADTLVVPVVPAASVPGGEQQLDPGMHGAMVWPS